MLERYKNRSNSALKVNTKQEKHYDLISVQLIFVHIIMLVCSLSHNVYVHFSIEVGNQTSLFLQVSAAAALFTSYSLH